MQAYPAFVISSADLPGVNGSEAERALKTDLVAVHTSAIAGECPFTQKAGLTLLWQLPSYKRVRS